MSTFDDALPGPSHHLFERLIRLEDASRQNEYRGVENRQRIEKVETAMASDHQVLLNSAEDIKDLKSTLNKLVWAVVGLALTIAGSAVGLALTIAAGSVH